ncbi:Subtilisin-like protease [Triticum urartu]|uniref:Subtilisin-like protease n=1 Tax=Triticum urartu TaxID=4572 RepID=M8A4U6_TRIUA|nr:Subtilisin-like protease [Triticum urartu]
MSRLPFFLFLCLFSFFTASASTKQGQVYIVYLGEDAGAKSKGAILDDHHALLLSVKGSKSQLIIQTLSLWFTSEEEARASLLYSYKHTLNGFAALLSEEEATKLSERTEVVSTFRSDGRWSPHTTRSWEFVGLEEGLSQGWLPSGAHAGENVIVGMLDSGIWPESRSFSDEGLGPVPARWKGITSIITSTEGQTVTPYQLPANRTYPMVYAAHAVVPGTPANVTNQCLPNSLSPKKVRGKIVVCLRGSGLRVGKGLEVKRAGGAAIVLGNPPMYGSEVPVDAHVLPGTAVSMAGVNTILKYINSSANPTAYLDRSRTVVDVKPSPVMAQFSSRGPNALEPSILKPDVTAPGLNILAAWSEASSPTKLDGDDRVVKYNIISGTSMSCPHVSATAVLLKSAHPDWSTAAFRPRHALDPGLVYDASFQDYLLYACASEGAQLDHSFPCPASPPRPHELNYPSVAIHGLNGSTTVHRTVTNVGEHGARYSVAVVEPMGFSVKVSPTSLAFARTGEKKSFTIKIAATGKRSRRLKMKYLAGSYTWSDGVHAVRSPVVVLVA